MPRILILENDPIMAKCYARALEEYEVEIFANAVEASEALAEGLPDLIITKVLLDGPDCFTFLNELISYSDTAAIPVIVISGLDLTKYDLSAYGVRRVLSSSRVTPAGLRAAVEAELGREAEYA